ncbi:transcriptional regulator GcvA [Nitratireductor sp. ZSWI3]|uniref:transcriptional regulator GcvA n=1 Tax=Nitratireductor sp. ZSWI3 TaxID=2966359 RepID=UPI00214F7437|nr:transcriptional regulator GcvA [Nitratireductor sp. ZSWI3]MCR4265192.1 transcriptional regulator GcvA [Nitratireductor sp. ZSWI3]
MTATPTRLLPPMNPLKAFEAAARHRSLTVAADELNVSQVAVSRQVRVLEDYLGVTLFRRQNRGIELTREGVVLFEGIAKGFQDIEAATRRVSRRGQRNILAIQSYVTFSHRWLMPRLHDFHDAYPRIEVRLSSSPDIADFETGNLDAAIRGGDGQWPDLHAEKLADMELIPVCSPAFLVNHSVAHVDQLENLRLLCSAARPNDWPSWLKSAGASFEPRNKLVFENSSLACEGALMDLGIAIANRHFVRRQLNAGTLVSPLDHGCRTGESYYLTWPKGRSPSRPLLNFLDWIRTQIAEATEE